MAARTKLRPFANFLTGNANGGFSQLSRVPVTDQSSPCTKALLQDNWKARPRLTLNLGVRYGYFGQPWDANLPMSNFDPAKYSASAAPTIATTRPDLYRLRAARPAAMQASPRLPIPSRTYVGPNYINGMIFNGPNAANNNQASPYGTRSDRRRRITLLRASALLTTLRQRKDCAPRRIWLVLRQRRGELLRDHDLRQSSGCFFILADQSMLDTPAGGATHAVFDTPARMQGLPLNFQTPYVQQFSLDIQQEFTDVHDGRWVLWRSWNAPSGRDGINQPMPGAWVGTATRGSYLVNPMTISSGASVACLSRAFPPS